MKTRVQQLILELIESLAILMFVSGLESSFMYLVGYQLGSKAGGLLRRQLRLITIRMLKVCIILLMLSRFLGVMHDFGVCYMIFSSFLISALLSELKYKMASKAISANIFEDYSDLCKQVGSLIDILCYGLLFGMSYFGLNGSDVLYIVSGVIETISIALLTYVYFVREEF